jgi:hypothetical protein
MFSFPPEFPFVSGRKPDSQPRLAAIEPTLQPATAVAPEPMQAASQPAVSPTPAQQPLPASPPPLGIDRRKARRDRMASAALLHVDGYHGPPARIELTDISIAGARFRCPRPLDAGEKAQIRVEVGPLRWTTRLRVVYCTPLDNGSVSVGCAFLRTELLRPWPTAA